LESEYLWALYIIGIICLRLPVMCFA